MACEAAASLWHMLGMLGSSSIWLPSAVDAENWIEVTLLSLGGVALLLSRLRLVGIDHLQLFIRFSTLPPEMQIIDEHDIGEHNVKDRL